MRTRPLWTFEHELSKLSETIVDAVHPASYQKKVTAVESYERPIKEPSLGFCRTVLRNYLTAKLISSAGVDELVSSSYGTAATQIFRKTWEISPHAALL